jgi:hypothetical protein
MTLSSRDPAVHRPFGLFAAAADLLLLTPPWPPAPPALPVPALQVLLVVAEVKRSLVRCREVEAGRNRTPVPQHSARLPSVLEAHQSAPSRPCRLALHSMAGVGG